MNNPNFAGASIVLGLLTLAYTVPWLALPIVGGLAYLYFKS